MHCLTPARTSAHTQTTRKVLHYYASSLTPRSLAAAFVVVSTCETWFWASVRSHCISGQSCVQWIERVTHVAVFFFFSSASFSCASRISASRFILQNASPSAVGPARLLGGFETKAKDNTPVRIRTVELGVPVDSSVSLLPSAPTSCPGRPCSVAALAVGSLARVRDHWAC